MAPAPSLNVSLTPHLVQFIETLLSSGRYQTASEVVRAALRLLEKSEATKPQPLPVDGSKGRREKDARGHPNGKRYQRPQEAVGG
jgi:antitoxin ParD1/3/4